MRKIKLLIPVILILLPNILSGKILNVPKDYSTIQSAIDAAQNSDTVLVEEGTYFENINFTGKGIVLTSRYFKTKDLQTIVNTVINGSKSTNPEAGSCISLISKEDSTAVIQGFTITGGFGSKYVFSGMSPYQEGGGIILSYSSAVIKNNIIRDNKIVPASGVKNGGGGGIASMYGNPTICNNVVYSNVGGYASGIVLNWSGGRIRNNIIFHNSGADAFGSGGVMIWLSPKNSVFVENNVIAGNVSNSTNGGMEINVDNSNNPVIRNNIIWGNRQKTGKQITNAQLIRNNNIEETYAQNISFSPAFEESTFALSSGSPLIDAGDTASAYNDAADPTDISKALAPSRGSIRNDIGAFGGKYAGILPSINVQDIYVSKTAASVQSYVSQEATAKLELLNLSSTRLIIDSVSQTNNSEFTFKLANRNLAVLQSDSLNITFKPKVKGSFIDTVKIYHKATLAQNPLKIVVQGNADEMTSVETENGKDQLLDYKLYPNYPNPFNPSTRISFNIPKQSFVALKVFDILGREVECLLKNTLSAGKYSIKWVPRADSISGIYLLNLLADNFSFTQKMILQK